VNRAGDTSADATEKQLEVYRRMAPADRLRVGLELTRMARDLLGADALGVRDFLDRARRGDPPP
jgi:hypothetical protein